MPSGRTQQTDSRWSVCHFYELKITPSETQCDQFPEMSILLKSLHDSFMDFLCLFSNEDLFLMVNKHMTHLCTLM